jgi:hypothetical protein
MKQNASYQMVDGVSATAGETPVVALPLRDEVVLAESAASDVIVQCLLIAARRGRQIRLAREQAAQLQQSELESVSEETP